MRWSGGDGRGVVGGVESVWMVWQEVTVEAEERKWIVRWNEVDVCG